MFIHKTETICLGVSRQECGSDLRLTGPDKSGLGPDCSLERRPEAAQVIRGRLRVAARYWCRWRYALRCWTDSRDWSSAPPSSCLRNRTRRSNYWQNQVDQLLTEPGGTNMAESGGANADRQGETIITTKEHLLTKNRQRNYHRNQAEQILTEPGREIIIRTRRHSRINRSNILKDDF